MNFGIWIGMIVSALVSFGIAHLFEQPVHWYLLILLIATGLFINTVIIILKLPDEHKS